MLNVEHVCARRDRERLVLVRLAGPRRARALEIAARLLEQASRCSGATRDELEAAFAEVEVAPRERRLADGLTKLVEDASEFQQVAELDPAALRSELFLRASEARREASLEAPFSRDEVLRDSAAVFSLTPAAVEEMLYADLRGAQRLVQAAAISPEALVLRYEQAQVQAVLHRAVKVVARVRCKSPDLYRALFQKIKFRQLLFSLSQLPDGDYVISIDGPFSLFESVTKYGLELALSLPALEACDVLDLSATVLWGKSRTPLRFEHHHASASADRAAAASLRDEVRVLLEEFRALESEWQISVSDRILEVPGVGLCVPDLVFQRPGSDPPIYLELLGFWSRDAVFRRLELARSGLAAPILFAASSRLRVSEALVGEDEAAGLYVYRGKPSARAIERKLAALASRASA